MNKKLDLIIISSYFLLVILGVISIYSNNFDSYKEIDFTNKLKFDNNYNKQLLWILLCIIIIITILLLDPKWFSISSNIVIYLSTIFLLILVLYNGLSVSGSKSWINLGFCKLQPSELCKISTSLIISSILTKYKYQLNNLKWILCFIIISIPILLITLQGDIGSATTFLSFIIVLYREGLSIVYPIIGIILILSLLLVNIINSIQNILIIIFFSIVIFTYILRKNKKYYKNIIIGGIMLFISILTANYITYNILKPYQRSRITVLFNHNSKINLKNEAYNLNQSKIAIGSGRLFGKGFLKGTQTKYNFIPQQDTDFIFCTIAEQWGFIGSNLVIILYLVLILRIIFLIENQNSIFTRIYGYSFISILFIHIIINVGMTLGLIPVIGITLPYISYGGSSLVSFTIFLFILIRLISSKTCIS
ncbi:MAG: rod shape-determining protein RodA [Bacteroides sp.]|nr:MAG: rod shape-determining protein RodA [Bacteroides sp.]